MGFNADRSLPVRCWGKFFTWKFPTYTLFVICTKILYI